jgi:aldehyde dehydrogenase (NAD+)
LQFVQSKTGSTLTIINPFDESVVTTMVQVAGPADIENAVAAANAAFTTGSWSTFTGAQRAACMNKFADLLEVNAEQLAYLDAVCMGMPSNLNVQFFIPAAASVFRCECFEIN